ncbi:MAG: TetR/AcrR family transcriptional regulator [Bacteroidetes bacterium]|nr:TetR/AcrR family transcriptional regulator [Bacteroidota bacterium]
MEEKEKILYFAGQKFEQSGFYKTTMDEIAKELKISKKTIYKHFPKKEDLVRGVIDTLRFSIEANIREIVERQDNAVIKLYKISSLIAGRVSKISDVWLNDLRFHGRELWIEMDNFRKVVIQKNLELIVNQGKKEGLIVDKPNVIILTIIISSIQAVVNPEFILNNNISIKNAVLHTLDVVFSGILTKQGRKIFKEFKSGKQNE